MKINKQVKGGLFGFNDACKQDDRLKEMAQEYIDNKSNVNRVEGKKNRLNGLGPAMDKLHVNKALHILLPHKDKNEGPEYNSFYEDSNRLPNCSEERKKMFYMLALKKAEHNSDRYDYKPYFDALFKNIEETKKQAAKEKLKKEYGFKLEHSKPLYTGPEEGEEGEMFIDSPSEKTDVSGTTDSEMTDTTIGGTRKNTKNLCHKKSVRNPNKCKKVKGCKVANGTKRSYCRKAKNTIKRAKESIKNPIKLTPRLRRSKRVREHKQPLAKFPRIAWKPDKGMFSQNQIDYMKMK
jgi:hypothetical protein